MTNNQNQPNQYDAVLGGNAPPPIHGAVLGGIEGVKKRLASSDVDVQVAALKEALNYGDVGLDLVIQALENKSSKLQLPAYLLLRERTEFRIKQAIKQYKSWRLPERLDWYSDHFVSNFANKIVKEFEPEIGINDPNGIAYAIRCEAYEEDQETFQERLETLTQDSEAGKLEALIIGMWDEYGEVDSSNAINALVSAKDKLKNLKAVFIGDIEFEEWMISSIEQSDISPLLNAYPQLEIIQIRGSIGLELSQLKHENLKAIVIESGGLSRDTIAQICTLDLPALQHLELWLGSRYYGGNSSIDDLMPILEGKLFPSLSYLGLRNSEYSDDIARALVKTSAIKYLDILDLAMGTLSDEGADFLLKSPAVNQLDILNVHDNFLSKDILKRLSQLDCKLMNFHQKQEESDEDSRYKRYCSIAE